MDYLSVLSIVTQGEIFVRYKFIANENISYNHNINFYKDNSYILNLLFDLVPVLLKAIYFLNLAPF